MARQINIDDIVEKLRDTIGHPLLFKQVYEELNLTDTEFPNIVLKCAEHYNSNDYVTYRQVFVNLIRIEYLNFSLVTEAFKLLLGLDKEIWIQDVIKYVCIPRHDQGSEICLCHCVAESVSLYQEAGLRVLTRISSFQNQHSHPFLSCILQRVLAIVLANRDSAVRFKDLDAWLRQPKLDYSRTVDHATQKGCSYFKDEVQSSELSTQVQWCFNNGLECVAVYMLFMYENYSGIVQFINNNAIEIRKFPRFVVMLSLRAAIVNNALDVTLAVINLYDKHNQSEDLYTFFDSVYPVFCITERQWQALISECRQKGYKKWTMYLSIKRQDWDSMERQAQTCGDPVLVDHAIRLTHNHHSCSALLGFSSKRPPIVAVALLGAIRHGDIYMVSKVMDEGYIIDTNLLFTSWTTKYRSMFPLHPNELDREGIGMEMTGIIIKKGLLCRFRRWLEENRLSNCIANNCESCETCEVKYFENTLDGKMSRLLHLLLYSDSVPSLSVRQKIQKFEQMKQLPDESRECAAMLISFQSSRHRLQNLISFTSSRQINMFP